MARVLAIGQSVIRRNCWKLRFLITRRLIPYPCVTCLPPIPRYQSCRSATMIRLRERSTDIDGVGAIIAAHGAYFIVDAVSSFGGMKTHPEDCQADIYITGASKCLGAPPALTLAEVSDRVWSKIKTNPAAPRASMLSILDWENAWSRAESFPLTPSVAEVNGLDVALDLYLGEDPEEHLGTPCADGPRRRAGDGGNYGQRTMLSPLRRRRRRSRLLRSLAAR